MPTLHLGTLDVAYSDANGDATQTTFQVAEELEKRYAPMQTFFESRKQKIADWLADDIANAINRLVRNGTAIKNTGTRTTRRLKQWYEPAGGQRILTSEQSSLTYGADQRIETEFRRFIFSNEMGNIADARGLGGTFAAKAGVSRRFKDVYNSKGKRKARPFLVDSGLYVSTFRVWTTKD